MDRPPKTVNPPKGIPEIIIHLKRCKECSFCVYYCPKDVLVMDGDAVNVAHPESCNSCQLCVWVCPDFAITVTPKSGTHD